MVAIPLAPRVGGTQSAPSPMVAVPGAREAPVILGTGIGMSMPKMECKINLRGGNQDAWRRWLVNRNDVITAHGLDALMDKQLMPTLEVIGERFPSLSFAERQETLVASTKQYLSENTKLYFLVKDSVDISGAYEQLDTDYINKSFVGGCGVTEPARRPRLSQLGRELLRHHQGRRADLAQAAILVENEGQSDGCVNCRARGVLRPTYL